MRPLTKVAALAVMATLSACSHGPFAPPADPIVGDSVADHPIGAYRESRQLVVGADRVGLVIDGEAVRSFVVDHARAGEGPISVTGSTADVRAAFRALMDAGARASDLRAVTVAGGYGVTLTFPAWSAAPPRCGEMTSDARLVGLWGPNNDPSSDWGCTSQRNLALMLVNPKDAVTRRGDLPSADAEAPAGRVQDTRSYARPDRPTTVQTN
jgi:pilus assembly protein CpaD